MTFAPVSVRRRKIRNGTSGAIDRRSMTTKTTMSTTDSASRPIVWFDPQPARTVSTSAKTSSERPAVTVIAPNASKCRVSDSPLLSTSSRGARNAAMITIGTLTHSTHSQPAYFVSTPPSRTPAAPPEPETAPQTPSALLRSAPSLNMFVTIDSADGASSAAPSPCAARQPMSCSSSGRSRPSATRRRTRPGPT